MRSSPGFAPLLHPYRKTLLALIDCRPARQDKISTGELDCCRIGSTWRGNSMHSTARRAHLHKSLQHKVGAAPLAIMFQALGKSRYRH